MGNRGSGKLDEILLGVVNRLISQVDGANEATCYLCLNPDFVPASNPGSFVFVVAPTGGEYDEAMIDGGGQAQCTVAAGVIVKIFSPLMLDQGRRDAQFLTHESLGIIEKWRRVLKALTDYSPVDGNGNENTRNPLIPHAFAITKHDNRLGAVEQTFQLTFDWALT